MTVDPGATPAPRGPFDGILVVDLTRILAGPYCTLLLAELGARVIKVERPPGGDEARRIGPAPDAAPDRSAYFQSVNRGKQSIALDLELAGDRAVFEALLERADVLAENFRPGVMEKLGYGWETLHARWPRLIVASTSGFGQSGPLRSLPAYDVVAQALGGMMSLTGEPGRAPARVGVSLGDLSAGMFTALGVSAALYQRERSGMGQRVDVAMLDSQVALVENAISRFEATGEVPGPMGSRHPAVAPFQAFATADGHLVIAAGNDELFARLARAVERPALASDPRFASAVERMRHVDALQRELEDALAARGAASWVSVLRDAGVPCAPVQRVGELLEDPQVRARNMIVEAVDPELGRVRMAGNPVKLSAAADPPERAAAPRLDADRAAILAELGMADPSEE
ncbi:MAG TPA: CoA transferase [Thermoanaerobaculia bacterium]|nr:CoA transferase [Thermoanaerobaculia bacterium]